MADNWPECIPPYLVKRLSNFNIRSPAEVLLFSAEDLSETAGISLSSSTSILASVAALFAPKAVEGLETFNESCLISSSLPQLDRALGGGLRKGSLIELCGESGVGKTQMCQTLAAEALSQNRSVYWIDTEGTFRPERVFCITDDLKASLDCLSVCQCRSLEDLSNALCSLNVILEKSDSFALIVIDSIAAIARFAPGKLVDRQKSLHQIARRVKRMNSVTIVTNHVSGDLSGTAPLSFRPALGNTWAHDVNVRLWMQMETCDLSSSKRRWIQLVKVPSAVDESNQSILFTITSKGIKEH